MAPGISYKIYGPQGITCKFLPLKLGKLYTSGPPAPQQAGSPTCAMRKIPITGGCCLVLWHPLTHKRKQLGMFAKK